MFWLIIKVIYIYDILYIKKKKQKQKKKKKKQKIYVILLK